MYFGASGAAGLSWESWSSDCMLSAMLCGPRVLAVHLGNVDFLGVLGLMRMLRTGIDAQIAELHAAKRPARNHPLDRLLDDALGVTPLEDFPRGALLDVTDIAGVLVIDLLLALASGQHRMRGVDDDDVVAAIDMGRVGREVLAAQPHGNVGGEPTDH